MAFTLPPAIDLTGVATFKQDADFVPGIPTAGLTGVWRSLHGVTLVSGAVSEWDGLPGLPASQSASTMRPTYSSGVITFDGSNDNLATTVASPTTGYFVARVKANAAAAKQGFFLGAFDGTASGRIGLGHAVISGHPRFALSVGSLLITSLFDSSDYTDGTLYTVGGYFDGSNAYLRVNGTQKATLAYTGGPPSSSYPLVIGARTDVSSSTCTNHGIKAIAVYSGTFSGTDLNSIDSAIGAL